MSVPELIEDSGYEVEVHEAITSDGFLLQLHRIPSQGQPVLLMHGLLCSSYCWVTSGHDSLAFLLSDLGYDVWLGNFRGTRYSRQHTSLNPDEDAEFWRFTLHELGVNDLATMIATVIEVSGKSSLSFVGHSMGTTAYLILASTRPREVEAVSRAVLLAPVVEPHNMRNIVSKLSGLHRFYRWACELLGLLEILPSTMMMDRLTWDHLLHVILRLGPLSGRRDSKLASQIVEHARSSKTSIYAVLHYAQNIANKVFTAYDWEDAKENTKRYGVAEPPSYQLSQINTETALFWSPLDSLSSKEDMERLVKELPNVVACRRMELGHLDYLWGSEVGCPGHLYNQMIELLPKADQSSHMNNKLAIGTMN